MIAATYTQDKTGFRIEDVPMPEIGDEELLVRVEASSICGTDMRIIRNGHRKLVDGQKLVLGHELAGTIERVGARVKAYHPGQYVGIAPNLGCGQCTMCARGLPNMCPDYTAFGITFDGAHAEYVRVPQAAMAQSSVIVLPEQLPPEEAALLEPLSCVVNGNQAARIEMGDVVVVFGAGPIGLMHLMLANLCGASKVIVIDVRDDRLEKARQLGAAVVVNSEQEDANGRAMHETQGRGVDVVITACSVAAVQNQALAMLAPFGRLCFFAGLPKDGSNIPIDTNVVHYKNLLLTGTTGGSPRDFRTALALVASGRIDLRAIISHQFAQDEMDKAFNVALNGETMKVVLRRQRPTPSHQAACVGCSVSTGTE